MEMVQEIYQVLIDNTDTCHRTCFSLQLNNQTMDNFAELKTIEGLKEGSVVKVVEGEKPRATKPEALGAICILFSAPYLFFVSPGFIMAQEEDVRRITACLAKSENHRPLPSSLHDDV